MKITIYKGSFLDKNSEVLSAFQARWETGDGDFYMFDVTSFMKLFLRSFQNSDWDAEMYFENAFIELFRSLGAFDEDVRVILQTYDVTAFCVVCDYFLINMDIRKEIVKVLRKCKMVIRTGNKRLIKQGWNYYILAYDKLLLKNEEIFNAVDKYLI